MAKRKAAAPPVHYTLERAARLYRLVKLLGRRAQSRASLTRALRLNVRGFYRDLEVLRQCGIKVSLIDSAYVLEEKAERALDRLPFPDPALTLGEARQLARGRTAAHRKLSTQLRSIER
jgi:predicted DNA-binding transcriptional regulator YafY